MTLVQTIGAEELTQAAVAEFGNALMFHEAVPSSHGAWWHCWEGAAELSSGRQWVGFVRAQSGVCEISEMERERGTEIIIPVEGEIIQVVALGSIGEDGTERPDPRSAQAFVLKPGTALLMAPGVWHAAAFGSVGEASYFYVAERRKAEDSEGRGGWVALSEKLEVKFCLDERSAAPTGR